MNRCFACNEQCSTNSLFCDECRVKFIKRFQSHEGIDQTVSQFSDSEHRNLARRKQVVSHYQHLPQKAVVEYLPYGNDPLMSRQLPFPSHNDPLMSRQLPSPSHNESEQAQKEAIASSLPEQQSVPPVPVSRFWHSMDVFRSKHPMRIAIVLFTLMVVLVLIADIVLASLNMAHRTPTTSSLPVLTVSPTIAHPDQIVILQITHFPALTDVFLTHDVQEAVRTDTSSPLIQVGPSGSIEVHILVENTWASGIHTIDAEDVTTHHTASTMLQITGNGQIQPPRLMLGQHVFNMGSDLQGANSIQPLTLRNEGGNSISWFADSAQPWLFTTPVQGVFSDSQSISIAVTRANLSPGTYTGSLSLHWTMGSPVQIKVTMIVLPFVKQKDTILTAIAPALSFMAVDGNASPADQLVTVSNPGQQPLYWNTTGNPPSVPSDQAMSYIPSTNWMQTVPTSGTLASGATAQVYVMVHSSPLLPGVYSLLLYFSYRHNDISSFQPVAISLTVQPRCAVVASMGVITFSVVAGKPNLNNPNAQSIGLSTTSDCPGVINWQASTPASWLTMTPARGQLQNDSTTVTTVGIADNILQPGTYTNFIIFVADQRTQTVLVQLTVLPFLSSPTGTQSSGTASTPGATSTPIVGGTATPQPGMPSLSISSQNLNFSAIQGQENPASQRETISNNGGSTLNWQASFASGNAFWLNIAPMSGSIPAAQSEQQTVRINTSGLSTGTYSTQVTVSATDSSGAQVPESPQFFTVTVTILQPCTLQVTPNNVTFSVVLLNPNPPDQSVMLSESGDCIHPVSWSASVDANSRTWLSVNNSSGQDNGSGSPITIHVNTQGIIAGKYTGHITIEASGNGGAPVQSSPQTVTVTLSVLQL